LGLRRRPVDLVREDDVREDGYRREDEMAATGLRIFLNDLSARDVARHEVRRKLNSREFQIEDLRHGVNEQRLREPRHADDQAVAAGEQRQQHEIDHVLLTDDQLTQLGDDSLVPGLESSCKLEIARLEKWLGRSNGCQRTVRCRVSQWRATSGECDGLATR